MRSSHPPIHSSNHRSVLFPPSPIPFLALSNDLERLRLAPLPRKSLEGKGVDATGLGGVEEGGTWSSLEGREGGGGRDGGRVVGAESRGGYVLVDLSIGGSCECREGDVSPRREGSWVFEALGERCS